jgi:hypothetical protein
MIFIKNKKQYILVFAMFINTGCMHKISHPVKIESSVVQKDKKTFNEHGCGLIWNIHYMNPKEISFRNTCTNQSCNVIWKSKNILGIWSGLHYESVSPQGELSHPVSLWDMHFEVDYYFQ